MSFDPYEFDRSPNPFENRYPLGLHLSNTFLWMFLGLMITFGVAIASWLAGIAPIVFSTVGTIALLIVQLVVVISLTAMIENMSVGMAKACFVAYSALTGLTFSVYFYMFELGSLIFVFLTTAVFFGVFGLYGRLTQTDLSSLRPILISGLVVLLVYGLITLFVPGLGMLDAVMTLGAVALFLAYTAYDMQKVERYYYYYRSDSEMLEKAAIFSALQLYLDFINLFIRLLRFLGKRKD